MASKIPTVKESVICIAMLGGFLNRKKDGDPGNTHIWRGLKRLSDLVNGWEIAYGS